MSQAVADDCKTFFSHSDAIYLSDFFSVGELSSEYRRAESIARAAVPILSIPREFLHPDIDVEAMTAFYSFPWQDYADCCREAIKLNQERIKASQPAPSSGRIDTQAIKDRVDIVSEVERYTRLHKSGRNYEGLCPLHDDKSPSFYVYPDTKTWHCFGACNTGGDVISFIMKAEGVDFKQAAAILGGK